MPTIYVGGRGPYTQVPTLLVIIPHTWSVPNVDEARWRGVALDGIATSAPYDYSALDPKSMEERGIWQSRRKPKFPYVSFHDRTRYDM